MQIKAAQFLRGALVQPACWTGHDRRKKSSKLSHILEKQRGLKAGVGDFFIAQGPRWGFWELKAGKNPQSDNQAEWEANVLAAGGFYVITASLGEACRCLKYHGILLHPGADVMALRLDALLGTENATVHVPKRRKSKRLVNDPMPF